MRKKTRWRRKKRQKEVLRLINKVVSDLLSKDNISDNDKLSLLDDIAPLSVKEITYQVNNNILNNVLNVINERLLSYSSLIVSDNNNNNMLLLLASNNNNDNNYKDIIRLKERRNNTYELWSKISYNYGHDFNNSNNNNNIHTIGITLGMDYNINNDKYKLGLSYSFNMSNGKEIISNIISSYGKINNINNNYFLNFIINYGRMNVDISKNNSKHMNVNHTYIMNVISFNTTFGKEIKINNNNNNNDNNNNIIIPKMSLGYNHISRNNYEIKNIDIKVNDNLNINVISPSIGMDYITYINKDNSLSLKTSINFKYDIVILNNNDKNNDKINITYDNNNKTLNYKDVYNNSFNTELSFGIKYEPNNKLSISLDTYGSYDTNNYMNVGVSIEGRWRIR